MKGFLNIKTKINLHAASLRESLPGSSIISKSGVLLQLKHFFRWPFNYAGILILLIILAFVSFFTACEKSVDWTTDQVADTSVVIDAVITTEFKQHTIKVSVAGTNLNDAFNPLSGAEVLLQDNNSVTYRFSESPMGSGFYQSDSMAVGINRQYRLTVEYNGRSYVAEAGLLPVSSFEPCTYTEDDDNPGFFVLNWEPPIYSATEPAMWEVFIDWSFLPDYSGRPLNECCSRSFFYTLNSLDVAQLFKPDRAEIAFPSGSQIYMKKYSLTDGHSRFLRQLLSETEWRGGYFDVEQANAGSNFSGGAKGYFGLCSVKSLSFTVVP